MLPVRHRLRTDREFSTLFAQARNVRMPALAIAVRANQMAHFRCAIIVSAKYNKRATVRNKIRRQIRAVLWLHRAQIQPGFDFAITVKSGASTLSYLELQTVVGDLLYRAHLLKA